ncbi:MAG: adenylyl-sulfate kinase [Nitrospirota bacterium]
MPAGAAFWLTGLPGSGKTTLALSVKGRMPGLVHLQMDEMRKVVIPAPSYSEDEREHLYLGLVYTALVLTREGKDVIIDATANMRRWRDKARELIPNFHEIYVKCPIGVCREREGRRVGGFAPSGIYKKAEAGWPVPGVNMPYEEPLKPELLIECDKLGEAEAAEKLAEYIKRALG